MNERELINEVNRPPRRWPGILLKVTIAAIVLGLFVLVACVSGCTITPKPVDAAAPSFDGNAQNSGFLGWTEDGFGKLTAAARDRYNELAKTYGGQFTPAVKFDAGVRPGPEGTFLIDKEHLSIFGQMSALRRMGAAP